jgi:DNA polymerase phi
VLHFKLRVLDLLDVFLKNSPTNPLIVEMIPQLMALQKSTNNIESKTFHDKVTTVMNNRYSGKDVPLFEDPTTPLDILKQLHQQLNKTSDSRIFSAYTNLGVFLVKVLARSQSQQPPKKKSKKVIHFDLD